MTYRCRCGRTKNGQPYHSAVVKKWVCSSACAEKERKELEARKPKARTLFGGTTNG